MACRKRSRDQALSRQKAALAEEEGGGGAGGGGEETDSTKPVLTAGAESRISDTQATVRFTSSEQGRYYYTVVTHGALEHSINTAGQGLECKTTETTIDLALTSGKKDVYIVVKDAAGNISDAIMITVLSNQAAPTGLEGIAPTSAGSNDGKITGVNHLMEYKLSIATAYSPISGEQITGLAPGIYHIRYAADDNHYAGSPVSVQVPVYAEVFQYGLVKGFSDATAFFDNENVKLLRADDVACTYYFRSHPVVDPVKGQLVAYRLDKDGYISIDTTHSAMAVSSGLIIKNSKELSTNSTSYAISGNVSVFTYKGATPGAVNCNYTLTGINYVVYNSAVLSASSICLDDNLKVTAILIPETCVNVSKPTGLKGTAPTSAVNNDGKITGVDSTMEYKTSTGTVYYSVSGSVITDLSAGTYFVRYKENADHAAGPPASVDVPEYVAANQYGLVKAFSGETYFDNEKVKLFSADDSTHTRYLSDELDASLAEGQLIAYGLNSNENIGAIATDGAISINSGFIISDAKTVTISGVSYNIPDNAPVFTYDGVTPGAVTDSYDVTTIGSVVLNESMTSQVSVYLDHSTVAALLVPVSFTVERRSVSLNYNGNGNTDSSIGECVTVASGGEVTIAGPGSFAKTGCMFNGWNTSAGGTGTSYSVGTGISLVNNITLYAQWKVLEPLDRWTLRNPVPTPNDLRSVAYGNGHFVAVGDYGTTLTSYDGEEWTNQFSGTTMDLEGVAYGNGIFVAVGYWGAILTSINGTSWEGKTSRITVPLYGIAYGAGQFVAVGCDGTVLTSADGGSWTSRTSGTEMPIYGITYANDLFVAVGGYVSDGVILTSVDGVTWTNQNLNNTKLLHNITYGNGQFVAVGNEGTIITSTDGTTWNHSNISTGNNLEGITYGNGQFCRSGI